MCRNFFFLFPDLCPFPPPESRPCSGSSTGGKVRVPPPPPRGRAISGSRVPVPPFGAGSAARGRAGLRGAARSARARGCRSAWTGRVDTRGTEPQRWGQGPRSAPWGSRRRPPQTVIPGSSASRPRILIKVLCRSAHFQPISHEGACRCRWCMESSLSCLSSGPWSLGPVASTSWLEVLGLTGPPWCQKLACLLSRDVGFTSGVFPEFVKIPFLAACP